MEIWLSEHFSQIILIRSVIIGIRYLYTFEPMLTSLLNLEGYGGLRGYGGVTVGYGDSAFNFWLRWVTVTVHLIFAITFLRVLFMT